MTEGHDGRPGARITYGQLSLLEPVDSYDAEVYQRRDAQIKLNAVPTAEVIVVRPTSFASGMALGSAPLTVIDIKTLPGDILDSLSAETGIDVDDFKLIRIGHPDHEFTNRSLSEYSE